MLLFLNPFDNRHNPGCFPRVKIAPNIAQSYKIQTQWNLFFSLKIFSVFDWIQIVFAAAGELLNTMEPSHNAGQITPKYFWK